MRDQSPIAFIHDLKWADLPRPVQLQTRLNLLDLVGVAVGGATTRLSQIIRDMACAQYGGTTPMMLDGRGSSAAGVALAAGMTIDALDGHDGFNPAKGHIGCPLFAAILPLGRDMPGDAILTTLAMGYEFGARASIAQHRSVPDYHTSGSWGAVTGAAACTRLMGLTSDQTRHALGIAEYHGPRSQMMRCIDHPTMVKDGSGWGAMTAVTSADLAARGFTGAPAITIEDQPEVWADLGERWYGLEQYHKPYPVCRWAQPPIEGALALKRAKGLHHRDIAAIHVETFHESTRLAVAAPKTTEEAQYSTSFPCAVALVRDGVGPDDIADDALTDPDILRLSQATTFAEDAHANAVFPGERLARVTLICTDGRSLRSDWMHARWDATKPATPAELREKFDALTVPLIGTQRCEQIASTILSLDTLPFAQLAVLLDQPIKRDTIPGKSA